MGLSHTNRNKDTIIGVVEKIIHLIPTQSTVTVIRVAELFNFLFRKAHGVPTNIVSSRE